MRSFSSIFWNQQEGRLRALVRVCLFLGLWRAASVLFDIILNPPLAALYRSFMISPAPWLERALHFLLYLISALLVTWAVARWVDRRPLADLGLTLTRRWWAELAAGLLLGLLLMSLIFAALWLVGWVQVTKLFAVNLPTLPFAVALLGPILAFTVIGIVEEIVFRGFVLRNAAEGLRGVAGSPRRAVIAAWILTSVLFGFYHIFNPNSSWISTAYLILVGIMLGLPVVLTQRLALAIGLHITWNFAQGTLFGFRVSGNEFGGVTLIETRTSGPPLWTGGAFGPEAGLLALLVMSLGCALILFWLWTRDRRVAVLPELAIYTPVPYTVLPETTAGTLPATNQTPPKEHRS